MNHHSKTYKVILRCGKSIEINANYCNKEGSNLIFYGKEDKDSLTDICIAEVREWESIQLIKFNDSEDAL